MKKNNRITALFMAIIMIFSSSSVLMQVYAENNNVEKVYTIAGAHLDTSWIWEVGTTVKQFLRNTLTGGEESATKSHVGNFYLMDKYPDYKFNFEGAYRYELIKEYYPEEWEKLKKYVANGQWNTAGSMYENGDVTVVSPEGLIRNILYGNQFFADTFGNDSRNDDIYLPDAFGYGYVLPSVGAHCGLNSFIGFKLHMGTTLDGTEKSLQKSGKWKTNYSFGSGSYVPFESGVGAWVGPDGNYLFSALHSSGGYGGSAGTGILNSRASLDGLNNALYGWNGSLLVYGTGDRGGSPTEASVINATNQAKNSTADKKVIISTIGQWANDLTDAQKAAMLEKAYDGELLMNQHATGSYTARSMSHRLNSRSELLATATESSSVLADWLGTVPYPQDKITEAWKRVISHQFHDDITGTSNRSCYERNWNEYMISLNQFATEYENALTGIALMMDTSFATGTPVIIHNPVGAARHDTVTVTVDMGKTVSGVRVYDANGSETPSQLVSTDGSKATVVFRADVPSMGYKAYDLREASVSALGTGLSVSENSLSNDKYTVTLNKNGDISSIYDKELEKELLASPIVLGLFDDTEGDGTEQANGDTEWPAWEIRLSDYVDKKHKDYVKDSNPTITIEENGAARVAIRVVRKYGSSTFDQVISLESGNAPVKVDNKIDWFEDATLLKAVFNTTADNKMATYDLGLGAVERTTNTRVQGEVPAQKWADITDKSGNFGISILSDSKNGWDKYDDSTLRLTLIHTPYAKKSWIGSEQSYIDFGENVFSFAISSHAGTVGESDTQKEAQFFTEPMAALETVSHNGVLGSEYSFATLSDDDIIIRALKKAETGVGLDTTDNEYIVRFNEGAGKAHSDVRFTIGNGIASVHPVYGSEETIPADKLAEMSAYRLENGTLVFDMKKYEIRSFAITLSNSESSGSKTGSTAVTLPYNVDIISSNENKSDSTLDSIGTSFPSELLPGTINAGGVEFELGGRTDGENNAVIAKGQTIDLPSGDYNKLYFLAFSLSGDRAVDFTVGDTVNTLMIADTFKKIGSWEIYNSPTTKCINSYTKNQNVGFMSTHYHTVGEDSVINPMYMFMYELDIPSGASTVTLPTNKNVIITAMSVQNKQYETSIATKLYDRSSVSDVDVTDADDIPDVFYLTFDDENQFEADKNRYLSNGGCGMGSGTVSTGVTSEYAHSGNKSFMMKFTLPSDTGKFYSYSSIYRNVNIPVKRGMYLEYWLYTGTEDAKYVNIELTFKSGTLRDGSYYDQNGVKMHPAYHAKAVETLGEWTKFRCELTPDTVITDIGFGLDTGSTSSHGSGTENFVCIDDIYIGASDDGKESISTPLVTTIKIAEGLNTSSYTDYRVKKFNEAIKNAKTVALNENSVAEDIANAQTAVINAYKTIGDEPPIEITINSAEAPKSVNKSEAFVATIKTNTNTEKITVKDSSGKTLTPIAISYSDDIFTVLGDERVWTVTLKLRKSGNKELTFIASDKSAASTDAIKFNIEVK